MELRHLHNKSIERHGKREAVMAGKDLNTITEREKIGATMSKADGLSAGFNRTFAPYSANVLVLKGKQMTGHASRWNGCTFHGPT